MIPVENDNVLAKGRLMPGRMFLIDFAQVCCGCNLNQHGRTHQYGQWQAAVFCDDPVYTLLDFVQTRQYSALLDFAGPDD